MHVKSPFIVKPLALIIGSLFASVSFTSIADTDVDSNTTDESQEVVKVWATKISNESSLLSDDIDSKQADHLSDLLRDQPGIDVGGSHSTVQSINIRGMAETDLDISIDGVSQRNNMFHHTGNLLINADILKEVDIKLGTNSVLTNGLSGGVAFETKDAKDLLRAGEKFGARVHTSYGSNDYFASSLTLYSQLAEDVDAIAYFTSTDKNNPDDGDGDVIEGNNGNIQDGIVKLGWDINENNRVEVAYDKYDDEGEYFLRSNFGSGYNVSANNNTQHIEYSRETVSLAYDLDLGESLKLHSTVYNNKLVYELSSTSKPVSENTGSKILAESYTQLLGLNHHFRYGTDFNHQSSENSSTKDTADAFAVYMEDEIQMGERFYLTPGVRYNYYAIDLAAVNGTGSGLNKTYTDFTYGLAGRYLMTDTWALKASTTQLFKGPELRESLVKSNTAIDQNLKVETGRNNEIGIAYQNNELLGLDHLGFSTNVFRTELENYIDDFASGKGTLTNDGDYTIKGFESELSASKGELGARLTYSHSDSANNDTGDALRYEVGDSISLGVNYQIPELDMSVNWTSMVSMTLHPDTVDDVYKEGYDVHDLSVNWMPLAYDGLSVTAGVENIFDELYYSQASYTSGTIKDYEPGRNFKLSVAYAF